MKKFTILVLFAAIFMAMGQQDGRYRPTESTSTTSFFPTTTRAPISKYDQRWNSAAGRQWTSGRYDPQYDVSPRFDSRINSNPVLRPYVPRGYYDYRTIRLEEKVDAKGYRYAYETVGGILAEEVGIFDNIGLKNEGVRAQGYVEITDPQGVTFRIDYQSDSKEAYNPRDDAQRIPPTIAKLLTLLESHK